MGINAKVPFKIFFYKYETTIITYSNTRPNIMCLNICNINRGIAVFFF